MVFLYIAKIFYMMAFCDNLFNYMRFLLLSLIPFGRKCYCLNQYQPVMLVVLRSCRLVMQSTPVVFSISFTKIRVIRCREQPGSCLCLFRLQVLSPQCKPLPPFPCANSVALRVSGSCTEGESRDSHSSFFLSVNFKIISLTILDWIAEQLQLLISHKLSNRRI